LFGRSVAFLGENYIQAQATMYRHLCKAATKQSFLVDCQSHVEYFDDLKIKNISERTLLKLLYNYWLNKDNNRDKRYRVRAILEVVYPDKFDFSAGEPSPHAWKVADRKTKLPIGRTNNRQACVQIKGPLGKGSAGRYDVLNTSNDNTIEFRLFKGTMNPDSVFRFLEFVDAVTRFVQFTSAADSGLSYVRFVEWLVKDSFNVIRYNHLIAFLVEKKYIDRNKIRKRDLPTPVEEDGPDVSSKPKNTRIVRSGGTVFLNVLP